MKKTVVKEPKATMVIRFIGILDKAVVFHELYEGEIKDMSQQHQDELASMTGNCLARVQCSRQLSESNFGSGGQLFVNIQLTCNQDAQTIDRAVQWASHLAELYAFKHLPDLRQKLIQANIIKPGP